jgi:hypothetical protein
MSPSPSRDDETSSMTQVLGLLGRLTAVTNVLAWVITPLALIAILIAIIFF